MQEDRKRWNFKVIDFEGRPKVQVKVKNTVESFFPEDISAMILEKMKKVAENFLGVSVDDAVITVPAYFNNSQRQATIEAGKIAGLNVLRILNEPTAAALASRLNQMDDGKKNVLIYDLGGGTFDVSILTIVGGSFEIKRYGGDSHLGGEDFNSRLIDHFTREFKSKFGKDLTNSKTAMSRLRNACEQVKKALSADTQAKLSEESLYDGQKFTTSITRAKFESLNSDLFRSTIKHIEKTLTSINMSKGDIDEIIMVGGSTRIPKIQKIVQDYFDGKVLSKSINPDEAVAVGAAIQASLIRDTDRTSLELKIVDVTALSLGTSVHGGLTHIIIPHSSPIPVKCTNTYTTYRNNQTKVSCEIVEGERAMVEDNEVLSRMYLENIPPRPKGIPKIAVTFHIDENSILHIDIVEKSTNNGTTSSMIYACGRLSKEEIKNSIENAQRFREEDKKKQENAKARNDLESLCFDILDEVELNNAISKSKLKLIVKCSDVLNWMSYKNYEKNEYVMRKQELKSFYDAVLTPKS